MPSSHGGALKSTSTAPVNILLVKSEKLSFCGKKTDYLPQTKILKSLYICASWWCKPNCYYKLWLFKIRSFMVRKTPCRKDIRIRKLESVRCVEIQIKFIIFFYISFWRNFFLYLRNMAHYIHILFIWDIFVLRLYIKTINIVKQIYVRPFFN